MKKLMVLIAMLFITGSAFAAGIGSSGKKSIIINSNTADDAQMTQNDKNQVAGQLKGEGDAGDSGKKGKVFPKVQFDHKGELKGNLDHKEWSGKKGKFDHKGEMKGQKKGFLKGDKGFHKGEKGFHKGEKGFHKGEKGFLKYEDKSKAGKKGIIIQGGKQGKPNEIDDEVTWSKNKGLDGKEPRKGFLKYEGAGKPGAAGMPAVK